MSELPTTDTTPSMFRPGQHVRLDADGRRFSFTISKCFTPITKSVVVLAHCDELPPSQSPAIIKIFDPRFLDDRFKMKTTRPWSLEVEAEAARVRESRGAPLRSGWFNHSDIWRPEPETSQGRFARAALWEEYFYVLMMECYNAEVACYERLRALQGSTLPRLFLSGSTNPPDSRAILPPAVVLEYIPGVTLRDIEPNLLSLDLCTPLVRSIDSFAALDLFHADINHNNILFHPPDSPVRAVVIDFGCGSIKIEGENEEDWQFTLQFAADSRRIRRLLRDKGITIADAPVE
ncbi:hypothetical protein HGRIS_014217 [Hohenbuehelia grisea]|uniref:Protein kinase domain-containing protein n=1 Tax=Hohenbuehelia grisea TaxID=104357 RepID=A0ABR3JTC5_9AGAR